MSAMLVILTLGTMFTIPGAVIGILTKAVLMRLPWYALLFVVGITLRIAGQVYDDEHIIILSRVPMLCAPLFYVLGIALIMLFIFIGFIMVIFFGVTA